MIDLVSIIIPVYNPGGALMRCLESVINQTYPNIEIIIVNDGSSDDSDRICREFASKDNRIVYLVQQNAGVSAARNNGIGEAKGKYICFVDSDDFVEKDYVQSMMDAVMLSDAEIVIQGLKQIKDGKIQKLDTFEKGVFHVSNLSDRQFNKIFYYCGPYCKLFKTSIIRENHICFPNELSYGEDAVFYHAYLENCHVVELISNTSYYYIVSNQGALSTKTLSPDKFWQNQSNRRGAYKRLRDEYGLPRVVSPDEQFCKLVGVGGMLNVIFKSDADDAEISRYLAMMANDSAFGLKEIKVASIKTNIMLMLIKANNKVSRMLLKLIYG